MSYFYGVLSGDYINDEDFRLDKPLRYHSDYLRTDLEAPTYFVTDFGSLKIGMMRMYIYKRPATIHDLGYRTPGLISKKQIDWVFLEAMKVEDKAALESYPNWFRRRIEALRRWRLRWRCYLGVKFFGASSYKGGVSESLYPKNPALATGPETHPRA